ncbi:hypothetical protein [Zhaonella formicivorans]|jgi:hypothetical protein|nr:hypothetical protein [Zhaonella formicivorans]
MKKWQIWLFLVIWLALGVAVNVVNNIGTEHGGEGSALEEVEEH